MQNRLLMIRYPFIIISFVSFCPYMMAEEQTRDSTQQTEESSATSRWQIGLSLRDSDQGQAVEESVEESKSESSFSTKFSWQTGLSENRQDERAKALSDTQEAKSVSLSQPKRQVGLSGLATESLEDFARGQSPGFKINRS